MLLKRRTLIKIELSKDVEIVEALRGAQPKPPLKGSNHGGTSACGAISRHLKKWKAISANQTVRSWVKKDFKIFLT